MRMLSIVRKEEKCGQMWSRMVLRIMNGTGEKEEIHIEGMMIGMIGIGVGGVGEDTETVTDFGVGQQEGPGTTCIKIEVRDIHEKYWKSM